MSPVIVDTNVAVVANDRHTHAGLDCIMACVNALSEIRNNACVLVDDRGLILDEYARNLSRAGQPGVGDAFFKWLWESQWNPLHCRRIPITPMEPPRGFAEFPDDPELAMFDWDDRKFVATAIASGEEPRIFNATDRDWWEYRIALGRNSVGVEFLCPELMGRDE